MTSNGTTRKLRNNNWNVENKTKTKHKKQLSLFCIMGNSCTGIYLSHGVRYLLTCAPSKDTNQPAHMRSLITVYVVHMKKLSCRVIIGAATYENVTSDMCSQQIHKSACAYAKCDHCLRCRMKKLSCTGIIGAATYENVTSDMCSQQILKSACAYAQSD